MSALCIKFSLIDRFFARKALKIRPIRAKIARAAARLFLRYFIYLSYHKFT